MDAQTFRSSYPNPPVRNSGYGTEPPDAPLLILDFRRVPDLTSAGARLLGENLTVLGNAGVTAIITGVEATSAVWPAIRARVGDPRKLRHLAVLDAAIEWAEDQVIYRYGGFTISKETAHFGGRRCSPT